MFARAVVRAGKRPSHARVCGCWQHVLQPRTVEKRWQSNTTDTSVSAAASSNVQPADESPANTFPASVTPARTWTWSTNAPKRAGRTEDIPIKVKVPLTIEEVVSALENNGALDVKVVYLAGKSELAEAFICCTGKSMRHMQRLSDIITYALKKRKLHQAPGITGAEGYDCDDWMIVDCWNVVVHIFEAEYRQVLKLEKYWENMKPYNPDDWIDILERDDDEESDDDETDAGTVENDGDTPSDVTDDVANSGGSNAYDYDDSTPYVITEKEKAAADQVAALWQAHISGTGRAMKRNAREERRLKRAKKAGSSSSSSDVDVADDADDRAVSNSSDKQ